MGLAPFLTYLDEAVVIWIRGLFPVFLQSLFYHVTRGVFHRQKQRPVGNIGAQGLPKNAKGSTWE